MHTTRTRGDPTGPDERLSTKHSARRIAAFLFRRVLWFVATALSRLSAHMQITKGTRALVTGANGGIGSAIARALHAAGASLVVSGRRDEAVRPLAAALGADVLLMDLTDRSAVARCMAEI